MSILGFGTIRIVLAVLLILTAGVLLTPGERLEQIPGANSIGLLAARQWVYTHASQQFYSGREAVKSFIVDGISAVFDTAQEDIQGRVEDQFNASEERLQEKVEKF
ncbi:MAG: hypothetical protein WD850_02875 [Candidatus Spechtbacterales bacterium]